ncbi:LysE family transporter, partial [Puniceicoccaceae bacterium K14]|nr:LysE family transporter [Puniceicoccaceae bacterium K14]
VANGFRNVVKCLADAKRQSTDRSRACSGDLLLNPKVALFFLAFILQFVSKECENKFLSFLILGIVFAFAGLIICTVIAVTAARLSDRFRGSSRGGLFLTKLGGLLFTYLGIRLAFSE